MAESMASRLVQAAERALKAHDCNEWNERDARVVIAAALWELAAWADPRNPDVRLENQQRGAIRDYKLAFTQAEKAYREATVTLLELLDLHHPEAGESGDFGDRFCHHCGDKYPCDSASIIAKKHPNLGLSL